MKLLGLIDMESVGLGLKIVLTVILIVTSWVGYELFGYFMEARHQAFTHSSGYIESKKSKLEKLASEYRGADSQIREYRLALEAAKNKEGIKNVIEGFVAQREVIKQEMVSIAGKIPDGEVPEQVKEILGE